MSAKSFTPEVDHTRVPIMEQTMAMHEESPVRMLPQEEDEDVNQDHQGLKITDDKEIDFYLPEPSYEQSK